MVNVTIYSSTMDPSWDMERCHSCGQLPLLSLLGMVTGGTAMPRGVETTQEVDQLWVYSALKELMIRPAMSDEFVNPCNAFYSLLAHLQNSSTDEDDDKLFRYLCEVQILLDMLMFSIR